MRHKYIAHVDVELNCEGRSESEVRETIKAHPFFKAYMAAMVAR